MIAAAFGLLALFLVSGALPASAYTSMTYPSSTSASSTKSTPLPGNAGLTFSPASKVLIGPFGPYSATAASPASPSAASDSAHVVAYNGLTRDAPAAANPIPTVNCPGSGCDAVSASSGGAVGVKGLNALDDLNLFPALGNVEPADQGLCAGNGHVMETNNQGEILVFDASLNRVSSPISLDNLMGLTQIPANMGGPWSSGGDPSCLYDGNNGGHWFITEFVSTNSEASGGPFTGCFAAVANACLEAIAVSVTANPLGKYNVYFYNPNWNSKEPGAPYLLNDFAKIATTRDAFLLFYDEFPLLGGGLGGNFFNGAQELAFTKSALENGLPATSSTFNVAIENMGLYPTPDGACPGSINGGLLCWYQVIPAQAPDPTQFDNSHGGSGFMFASLDFTGAGDNRVAVFYWTGLSDLDSSKCSKCSGIRFGGDLISGELKYFDPGLLTQQKAGPTPSGDAIWSFNNNGCTAKCPEGPIASNGDGATQASFAQGQIWSAISTVVGQKYGAAAPVNYMGAA